MGCGDVRLLRTIGNVDFTGHERAALNKLTMPSEVISHAVWLYHRFSLSVRDVEDLLAERGITVTYETIRQWCRTFGLEYARRRRRGGGGRPGDTWYLDELFVRMQGRTQYLWRAVDEDGDVIDIRVQPRRNRRAAIRFFRKLLNTQGAIPRCLITDKRPSYQAACRTLIPSVLHSQPRMRTIASKCLINRPATASARCAASNRSRTSNASRRSTASSRISFASAGTSYEPLIIARSAPERSPNGTW